MKYLQGSRAEQERLLRHSTTLYVGNLSFYTTEEQIHELFERYILYGGIDMKKNLNILNDNQ